ncbi:transposable element P transposase [Trichonephila clavipes]|nr:transposable element P transposase [Trichonephila clavipes]
MVYACVVPNCNSNYKDTGTVQMFGFPKEDSLRKKCLQAISRKDFAPSKYSKVYELHFSDDAIRRYTEVYNEKTGEKICVPLKGFRLQNFAVPTIFTDFPTYLSNSRNPARECPEQRLQRLENEHLQRSLQASIISKEEFEKKKSFTLFPELVECLNAEELQDIWTVVCKNDLVIIMMLDTIISISPVIKASVIINKDLHLTILIGQTKIDQLASERVLCDVSDSITTLCRHLGSRIQLLLRRFELHLLGSHTDSVHACRKNRAPAGAVGVSPVTMCLGE